MDIENRNGELADVLSLIGSYYEMAKDNYRAKTFNSVSEQIGNSPIIISSGTQASKILKGLGKSSIEAIDEYLTTGQIQRLEQLKTQFADRQQVIDNFRSYYGIGPVTALKFYNQGFRTVEDLWEKADLTEAQRLGIIWKLHFDERISRTEMDIINRRIGKLLNKYQVIWTIAGSYRRGEPSSGDIDILVESRPDLNMDNLLAVLQPLLVAKLAEGVTKYMGILRLSERYNGHRIDIRIIRPESYQCALLYFTGSQKFNILMRQRAIELGLTLNEYGLYDDKEINIAAAAQSEADIFYLLGLKYLEPNERTNHLTHLEKLTH